jgi:ATP-dependent helicase/nuclease subunit B
MSDRPAVFTIPTHRSFADALAEGLIQRYGKEPLGLARGRILLPNNRAVRAVTNAFVRASGSGLLLPRLIPIGDAELEERVGGAVEALSGEPIPPAIEPMERLLRLASLIRASESPEALRLAADLSRALDALLIEEVNPADLKTAVGESDELAEHWAKSLAKLELIYESWPEVLRESGKIDLVQRRNLLLHRLTQRWKTDPPSGFTVAAGITTAAPAVAAMARTVAWMNEGLVVLPGLWLADSFADEEWDRLGPDEDGRGEATHPQYHLKLLLDRMGIARGEVVRWPTAGRASSPAARARAVANAMSAPQFSDKWQSLKAAERRLTGVRAIELSDAAAEAQAIALALRGALETPGETAALVTPDRTLARRVSALLKRWGIEADDSAGRALSETPPGTLLLGIAEAAAEELAPVPLLALLKHPLVGGEGDERVRWLESVRVLDLALRGPRPAPGIHGLDRHIEERQRDFRYRNCDVAWKRLRPFAAAVGGEPGAGPVSLAQLAETLARAAGELAGDRPWRGADGRLASELLQELQASPAAAQVQVRGLDAAPMLRQLLEDRAVRPAYGGHPRIFIWGLLEARLQRADLVVLGGLNEGVWPAPAAPDPWLAPKIRSKLRLPTLQYRVGLSAHDFASALGAPKVLVTRARRDATSPTVASRFWLRLEAMTGGITRDTRLERIVAALDDPGPQQPVSRPAPEPPFEARPKEISVTSVDRLKADPFAFYAREILKLPSLDPVDADHSAAWKGSAVHEVLEQWLNEDDCNPERLMARAERLIAAETIHPMLRAFWAPRLIEAIRWVEEEERSNQAAGRKPLKAEWKGNAIVAGVRLRGRADRIDRLPDGSLAIVDYKTGKAPAAKAVLEGFALQLGLLGLIAGAGGFPELDGKARGFEYWSLTKYGDKFGRCVRPDDKVGADEFLARAALTFGEAAQNWLLGDEPFWAKLNPAYAPYGEYDHLMRLEEWYGRK